MADPLKKPKSGLARTLLQKVSSRSDTTNASDDDMDTLSQASSSVPPNSNMSAASLQQSPATPSLGHRTQRHRPHLSATMSPTEYPASNTSNQPTSPASPTGASIEQSVKLFRIFEALRSGDTAVISKSIREQGPNDSGGDEARLEGTTVLHLAIQCAELPVVEFILSAAGSSDSGLDVNGRDRDGNTPLHVASMLGRSPIVRLLLENDSVNDSIPNYQGQTALDLSRTPEIFQQLQLARNMFIDATLRKIHELVARGDYTQLEKLLQDPRIKTTVDVNGVELATDPITVESGGTLLHEAARKRNTKLIQLLLLNGADPFRRDRKGKLPQDVTKDDRTRAIIKKSPAAAAAQRGIQEKTILGGAAQTAAGPVTADAGPGSKDGREMKGYLKKWTNYTSGWKLRWFVLEDGVLSYYKHQDDAGSACRGAINMKIAKLHMDPQDKLRFEIHGKSSVKYHLRANHQVEAKRWYWALNNAIQWAKDEAREEERRQKREDEVLRQMKVEQTEKRRDREADELSLQGSQAGSSRLPGSHVGDDDANAPYETSATDVNLGRYMSNMGTTAVGDDDEDADYGEGDDASSQDAPPVSRDAFNITAQSARLQLDLLDQVSKALQAAQNKQPGLKLADSVVTSALGSYDAAVGNLKGLVADLLRISRDREVYWRHLVDREANLRRLWEESMAKVAREQEEMQEKMGESEAKRKKTKRALRDALEGLSVAGSRPQTPMKSPEVEPPMGAAMPSPERKEPGQGLRESIGSPGRRKPTIVDLSDSDSDEEFFDAVGAGEVEVVEALPATSPPPTAGSESFPMVTKSEVDMIKKIAPSFAGYEDPVRTRLKMDADDRPRISLWGILKSMIGKDMTKMTLPVSFNEPTSLLQRVAEDMEYTDLLDTAADRADSTERMVYVAAFAASEYASTIGRVAKPFNPLLGETYEYCRPDKGFRFFIEQVSHHPPIGAAYAESPKWDYYGESAVKSKFYGKSFDINPLGTWFLRLRPTTGGTELYTWKKVTSSVIGIITGNPTVDNYGPMQIKNWTTGETCLLDFKPRGWKQSSAFHVTGRVTDAEGKTRWSIGGRWNDKLYARLTPGFEDTVEPLSKGGFANGPLRQDTMASNQAFLIWEAHTRPSGIPFNLTPFVLTLNAIPEKLRPHIAPTDTRLRPDQRAMEDGEYDFAATEKNRVEEKQRAARRVREARGEEFVPRWFTKSKDKTTGEEYWKFNGEYWKMREAVGKGGKWEGLEDIF